MKRVEDSKSLIENIKREEGMPKMRRKLQDN
jgi:hypothetical protein